MSPEQRDQIYSYIRAEMDDKYILNEFCDADGVIDWLSLVRFSSGNMP